MLAAGAALALANAAAYSSVLFDLIVLALALLTALPSGSRLAARRAATAADRHRRAAHRRNPARRQRLPHRHRADHPGPRRRHRHPARRAHRILVLGRAHPRPGHHAASSSARPPARAPPATWLLAVLTLAAIIGPLEQARLHTAASLNKHVGLGAWFAAIAAGYAIDKFIATAPAGRTRAIVAWPCVIALAFPLTLGAHPVPHLRHQLAQRHQLHRDLPPPRRPQHRPPARRGPLHRRVLPARRHPVAAMVQHPQHHPAHRRQHRPPHHRRRRRRRQPRHLRPLHRRRLLLPHRPELRRHHRPRQQHHRRPAPQPPLPPHPGHPLRHRHHPIGHGTYIIWQIPARDHHPSQHHSNHQPPATRRRAACLVPPRPPY